MLTTTNTTKKSTRVRPNVEALEDRLVPTQTILALDFSNDYNVKASLTNSWYAGRYTNGTYPRFLDMDGNGSISSNDVKVCASAVTYRVSQLFARYRNLGVRVIGGDYVGNQRFGNSWLNYGKRYSNVHVSVIYFGGYRSYAWGIAPIADAGKNVEGFGRVFSDGHANHYAKKAAMGWRVTSQEFVNALAATAAHEIGHMMGLDHVSGPANHLMTTGTRNHDQAYFPNQSYWTSRGWQNADAELIRSFNGQRTQTSNTSDYLDASPVGPITTAQSQKTATPSRVRWGGGCGCGACSTMRAAKPAVPSRIYKVPPINSRPSPRTPIKFQPTQPKVADQLFIDMAKQGPRLLASATV